MLEQENHPHAKRDKHASTMPILSLIADTSLCLPSFHSQFRSLDFVSIISVQIAAVPRNLSTNSQPSPYSSSLLAHMPPSTLGMYDTLLRFL
jgi:hypothetical protein